MTARPSTVAPITATLLVVLAPLMAAYVGGYFWLGKSTDWRPHEIGNDGTLRLRHYRSVWVADIFRPAAKLEALMTGIDVDVHHVD